MSYLKIRSYSAQNCGGFTLEGYSKHLKVSDTTARKNISTLLELGYLSETLKHNHYRVVSHKSIVGDNKHEKYTHISDEQLKAYSWRNFGEFRAYLSELRIEINRSYRKFKRRGYRTTDRHGVREIIKSQSNTAFDTLMAGTYVSQMIGISVNTAYKYRKYQKVSNYTKKTVDCFKKVKTNNRGEILGNYELGKLLFDPLTFNLRVVPISSRHSKIFFKGY